MADRPVFNNNRKIGFIGNAMAAKERVLKMLGIDGVEAFVPNMKQRGSKYKPHQGSGECARRVKQGLAGINLHVVAKPSQDFDAAQTQEAREAQCVKCHPQSRRALRLVATNV